MKFPKNTWYAAAWSEDIQRNLFPRRICGEPLLFFREEGGAVRAISDLCPHRFVPLSRGRLVGDSVECGYHGLKFNGLGQCTLNPHGDGKIPSKAKVRRFAVEERNGLVWVWMGEAEEADPSAIVAFPHLNDSAVRTLSGCTAMAANYQLAVDNILDPSHAIFLHANFHRTSKEEEFLQAKYDVTSDSNSLRSYRWVPNAEGPIHFMRYFDDPKTPVDHWIDVRWWIPSIMLVDIGVTRVGESVEQGIRTYGLHILTPETESTCHYIYAHGRNFRQEDPQADANIREWQRVALNEQDKPMVEDQQRHLGSRDLMSLDPILLQADVAAVRARRVLASRIKEVGEYHAVVS